MWLAVAAGPYGTHRTSGGCSHPRAPDGKLICLLGKGFSSLLHALHCTAFRCRAGITVPLPCMIVQPALQGLHDLSANDLQHKGPYGMMYATTCHPGKQSCSVNSPYSVSRHRTTSSEQVGLSQLVTADLSLIILNVTRCRAMLRCWRPQGIDQPTSRTLVDSQ